jgi:hypothetical protein
MSGMQTASRLSEEKVSFGRPLQLCTGRFPCPAKRGKTFKIPIIEISFLTPQSRKNFSSTVTHRLF